MDTFQGIRRVLWITMGLNLIPTFAKLTVGWITDSLSIVADGFDSVFDAASNVVGLVGIWVAAKPADEQYPYGRRKAETMTALIICFLLFITAYELVKTAIDHLLNPAIIGAEVNAWSFIALGVSIAIHVYVVYYELNAGRKLHSDVLVADALHTRADIFLSVGVAGGLVFVYFGVPVADPILTIIVAVLIGNIGVGIIKESVPTLMDKEVMPVDKVEQIVMSVPGIRSVHHVRSRGHEQAVFADLHIRVDPGMSTERGHAIAHEVGHRLRQFDPDLKDVTIHVEPDGSKTKEPGQEAIAIPLRRIAIGEGAQMHEIWIQEIDGEYWVENHLEVDGSLSLKQAHELASKIEQRACTEIPRIKEITSHLEPTGRLTDGSAPVGEVAQLVEQVKKLINEIEPRANCHDVQLQKIDGKPSASLHVNLPGEMLLSEAHSITETLEIKLRARIPALQRIIIHPEPGDSSC